MKAGLDIKWNCSAYELMQIGKISKRAVRLAQKLGIEYEHVDAVMDIEATHCNGCALDLEKLLSFDDANFGHDVFGIRRHVNRTCGQPGGSFLPRCAMPDPTTF